MRNKTTVILVILLSLLLIVSFGCKKKPKEEIKMEVTEAPPPEQPTEPTKPPAEIAPPVTTTTEAPVIMSTEAAIDQIEKCMNAGRSLLGWPYNEPLVSSLLFKSSALLSGIANNFTGSKRQIVDNAKNTVDSYISRLDSGTPLATGEVTTMRDQLKYHREKIMSLLAGAPPTTKTSPFEGLSKEEGDKLKKKFKEYGDELKKKYKEMEGK
ncbi:MAG: hypothetical protein ACUVWP_01885 [bacterium]